MSQTPPHNDQWPWPDDLDACIAAPASHHVLFENDAVRVLEVISEPGTREPRHTHRAPSVLIVDRPARIRYYTGDALTYETPGAAVEDTRTWLNPEPPPLSRKRGRAPVSRVSHRAAPRTARRRREA